MRDELVIRAQDVKSGNWDKLIQNQKIHKFAPIFEINKKRAEIWDRNRNRIKGNEGLSHGINRLVKWNYSDRDVFWIDENQGYYWIDEILPNFVKAKRVLIELNAGIKRSRYHD